MSFSQKVPNKIEQIVADGEARSGDTGNSWSKGTAATPQWSDPKPLPSGLLPVKPFDIAFLPPSIGPWAEDISDRMQCPPDFVALP
jgi:hypothetical protein